MTAAITVALVILAVAVEARAEDSLAAYHPLQVAREELFRSLEWPPSLEASVADQLDDSVLKDLTNGRIGLRPVIRLVPADLEEGTQAKPPAFALVARAEGRTLVAVTRPGAQIGPSDNVLLQRVLVSDLLKGRRFSLTVYKDHAFDEHTFRFLGVGARLRVRPSLELFGWRLNWQVFGSYHPDYGATGYVTVTAGRAVPSMETPESGE
jgi:hypothetical protein